MKTTQSDKRTITTVIAPTAISSATTTAQATATDTANYNTVGFLIACTTYSSGTFTPLINESDASNMSGENAVADADLFAVGAGAPEANAALAAAGTKQIEYTGSKRYITCDIVSTGTVSGTVGVYSILTSPTIAPIGA